MIVIAGEALIDLIEAASVGTLALTTDRPATTAPATRVAPPPDMILSWGARVVVLTLGADGALARNRVDAAQVGSPALDVADMVGAVDSFVAGLLRWLRGIDRLAVEAVGTLDRSELRGALTLAATVGALQCARTGALPPTLAEVEDFVGAPT